MPAIFVYISKIDQYAQTKGDKETWFQEIIF